VAEDDTLQSGTKAASVASLAFDGRHIAAGTHQGQARTWMQPAENTDFKTMLSPLQVDREQPVAHLMLSGARPGCPRCGGQRSAVGRERGHILPS
jgi:hypothetical protein